MNYSNWSCKHATENYRNMCLRRFLFLANMAQGLVDQTPAILRDKVKSILCELNCVTLVKR